MINQKYDVVIGIEIHIELATKSKMFSPAKNNFHDSPNSNVHPIDLGYPGTLPRLNKQAVIYAIKLAKVLNMEIDSELHFDRKNYFYPDLPKSFQITQQFRPIGKNGFITIKTSENEKNILINRIHLEEDTAKQISKDGFSYLNYNRAGVPLIEIVTEPVMKNAEEAAEYVQMIRKIAMHLNISDAKMEEGSLRVDVNLSLKPKNSNVLGTKVEIKNMNSVTNMKKAIELEIQEQYNKLENKVEILQQTKRFDDNSNTNIVMRNKTGEVDYKYYPEPNIPFIKLEQSFINKIEIPKMPWEKEREYLKNGLNELQVSILTNNLEYSKYFDSINFVDKSKIANLFFSTIIPLVNKTSLNINELNILPFHFEEILKLMESNLINNSQAKEILNYLHLKEEDSVTKIISKYKMDQQITEQDILEIIKQITTTQTKINDDYLVNPVKVIKVLSGLIMKETKGKANPQKLESIIKSFFSS